MNTQAGLYIFGEVLFDCFPSGEQVLGGAPFNVAWHLQALGDSPLFISRVGADEQGRTILDAMRAWGMESIGLQIDPHRPTGRVEVKIIDNEPHYDIVADSGYDYIVVDELPSRIEEGIVYHGTLALRQKTSYTALQQLSARSGIRIFLDVNLRAPWWQKEKVLTWLARAHWAKMNEHELKLLAAPSDTLEQQMQTLLVQCGLEQLIVTQGAQGAVVLTASGEKYCFQPEKAADFVDTVGAGDAFSAVYIHGLRAGWALTDIGERAQAFASQVIGLRGATTTDATFYQRFLKSIR